MRCDLTKGKTRTAYYYNREFLEIVKYKVELIYVENS